MDIHCDFCDRPMDAPEHKWDRFCRREDGHTMGVIEVKDSLGHLWRVEYDVQGGERSDQSPMTMFVKMSVDGHQYGRGEYGSNVRVSGDHLKTTATSEFETFAGLMSGEDEWDFDNDEAMERYSADARALRDSIGQVEAALTAFAQHTPSDLDYASLWDELVEGQRRSEAQFVREEMDRMMFRVEDELSGFDLSKEEKATALRKLADSLLTNQS